MLSSGATEKKSMNTISRAWTGDVLTHKSGAAQRYRSPDLGAFCGGDLASSLIWLPSVAALSVFFLEPELQAERHLGAARKRGSQGSPNNVLPE